MKSAGMGHFLLKLSKFTWKCDFQLFMVLVFIFTGSSRAQMGNDAENPTKSEASKNQWLVAIAGMSRQNEIFICTGSVISKTLILSSAWCLEQMPGELSLFSGKEMEDFKLPANVSEKDWSLMDHQNVVGCLKHLIFHPCYRRVQRCTNVFCDRVSWRYDLVVLETIEEMTKDIAVMNLNFLNWKEGELKDCVFLGFDHAKMYEKDKEGFFLVESKMKASRGKLPCNAWSALTDGVIWSKNRYVGLYRFLSITGGYLFCGTQLAGIFLGKISVDDCTVENHHDRKSTHKFWMSWTYMMPHKAWIDAVIRDPKKFSSIEIRDGKNSTFPTAQIPTYLIWFALLFGTDLRHIGAVFNAFINSSRGIFYNK